MTVTQDELQLDGSPRSRTFLLLSLLLDYPQDDVWGGRGGLAQESAALGTRAGRSIVAFLAETRERDVDELQRDYVATFDFAKRTGLHLTYHRYGERRERGMALVALKQRYTAAGVEPIDGELPDYLPAMLELAALRPDSGEELLVEHREAVELVRAGLRDEGSPYAHLLDALVACLPRLTKRQLDVVRRLAAEGPPPDEMVGLEPFAPPEVMPVSNGAAP